MATISEVNPDHFDAFMYAPPSANMMNFVQQMIHAPTDHLLDAGRAFMNQAVNVYERLGSSEAMARVKRAISGTNGRWSDDFMIALNSTLALQQAPVLMHRYLMAHTGIRELYHKGHCDGYSDTYVDMEPGKIGEDHYDYRRVMNGVVVDNENGGWGWTEYHEELIPGDSELDDYDQGVVLRSWDQLTASIFEEKEDPTSIYGGEL